MPTSATNFPTIISIGGFDGVHLGHQALVRSARELAQTFVQRIGARGDDQPRVCILVLDPSPAALLRPEHAPPRLTTFEERERLLRRAGAEMVVKVDVTADLLHMSPAEFLNTHIAPLNPVGIVEGPDFRFGKARQGDIRTVVDYFGSSDFLHATPAQVEVAITDLSIVPARSSMIRWLLSHGRVRDAAIVLGRPYSLFGKVVQGDRRGRTIGYPTANIECACMVPGEGVYGAIATLPDGRRMLSALSIGGKPTFNGRARTVEAFLMNDTQRGAAWAPIAGLHEYGWAIELEVLMRVRDQQKFAGLSGLVAQIERDCVTIADVLGASLSQGLKQEVLS